MGARGVLRTLDGDAVGFWCPGCSEMHVVQVPPHPNAWGFNGDCDKPTFTPSVLVRGVQRLSSDEYARVMSGETIPPRPFVCHSFVREGRIEFLGDCTHALAGQTVALPAPPI